MGETSSPTRLPDFLCIGGMRCGSTTLWELISRHPEVYMPARKELHFFDNRNGAWEQGVAQYARNFAGAPRDAMCGESTPDYLYIAEATDRIYSVVPRAKLIAILRDPVERAWSHYWFQRMRGGERRTFIRALDDEKRGIVREEARLDFANFEYLGWGRYLPHLERFAARFGRDRLLVIVFEDLVSDPRATMEQVFSFLGVDVPDASRTYETPHQNPGRYPRLRNTYFVAQRYLRRPRLPGSFRDRLVRAVLRRVRAACLVEGVPDMSPDLMAALRAEFVEDNAALSNWLARELPWGR